MPSKAKKRSSDINLLPSKSFSQTVAGRILSWTASTFRIIVIITELLVMIAFLSRFWLDAKINDQKDEISNKKAAISATLDFEREFRDLQSKLEIYKNITDNSHQKSNWFNEITSSLPADVYLTSINYSAKTGLNLEGVSPNEVSIQQLITNIQSRQFFNDASLLNIKTNEKDISILNFEIGIKNLTTDNIQKL
ncbi:MAG: PilN domain-containing protein [Patescibacteria group bacterium]|nr:PilN domain-containing protein [Patescibacteria group bacterium]